VRPPLRPCLRAGLATAVLFQIGKWALGLYFARAGLSDAYGPAGVVVLLMAWSYYVSLLVLIGSALARPARASTGLDLRGAEPVRDGTARDE
jgi:membrane protein